jgi:hypothetical protein
VNLGGGGLLSGGGGAAINPGVSASWGGLSGSQSPGFLAQAKGLYEKYGKYSKLLQGGQQQQGGLAQAAPAPAGGLSQPIPNTYRGFDWVGRAPRGLSLSSDLYDWRRYM